MDDIRKSVQQINLSIDTGLGDARSYLAIFCRYVGRSNQIASGEQFKERHWPET